MLYIKSLTINKFKSFNHAQLLLGKGFTCVIGPNGSGKSTICDALLFGLGENSTKRLRVSRYDNLIRTYKSNTEKLRTAYVNMEFGGDEELSITRATRSDGKTQYRVNGKHLKRFEVLEMLAKHGITADETNTIIQGEIASLGQMSPGELRGLIDIAAGIRDFDLKKDESLKELEKVNQKIGEGKVMLSERSGFLSELAAEKEGAEKYLQMNTRLRTVNYSILYEKKSAADTALSEFTSNLAIADGKEKEATQKLAAVNAIVEQLNADRLRVTKQLSDSTDSMGSTKAKLESVNLQMVKNEAEIAALVASVAEAKKLIESMETERTEKQSAITGNRTKIAQVEQELAPLEEAVKKARINPSEFKSNPDRIRKLSEEVQGLEQQLSSLSEQLSALNAELSISASARTSKSAELDAANAQLKEVMEGTNSLEKKLAQAAKKQKEMAQQASTLFSELDSLTTSLGKLDAEHLTLMEQKAYANPRAQVLQERLQKEFGTAKGFYGRASELCTYDSKYAYAVESAGGSRLEYLVVDTIESANRMIEYMKKAGLGRATFIPLKEVAEQRESQKPSGIEPVIKFVSYDKAYSRAFAYIFSNTYLLDAIADAKKYGIGKYRYVTLEGDIVEPAGIVSGGSAGKRQSLAAITARISGIAAEKSRLKATYAEKDAGLTAARKAEAYADMDVKGIQSQLDGSSTQLSLIKQSILAFTKAGEAFNRKEAELLKKHTKLLTDKEGVENSLTERKSILDEAVNEISELSRKMAAGGITKEELDELERKRKAVQDLKIQKAELEKEITLHNVRIGELQKQVSERNSFIKSTEKAVKLKHEAQSALTASRSAIERQISTAGSDSKKIFEKIGSLDKQIDKVGQEKGRLTAELNSYERQVGELRIRRSQVETTLKDLAAEFSLYKEALEPLRIGMQEMEKESVILNSKLHELGNVNLKAPELYAEKSKDVAEARAKVETLETEQQAIRRMVEEIESKKFQTFMSTFNDVLVNFQKFSGNFFTDKPTMTLSNSKDPFSGGLEITVKEGKTNKHLSSLSGGEKSLVLLILVFSIYMCRPSALYIFDEVDAALDKENAKKLSMLVKQMSVNSQFIVVSHNDSLITNADVAIGVVKTEGESKALGLEVSGMLSSVK